MAYQDDLIAFFEYIEYQHPDTILADIKTSFIRSWLARLKESGKRIEESGEKSTRKSAIKLNSPNPKISPLGSKSINRNISSLKSFFKYYIRRGVLQSSPMAGIISPKVKKRLPQFVDEDDIKKLFNEVNFPDNWDGKTHWLILQLFYNTGIRQAELLNLKESQIDKSNSNLKVLGKGNKERILPVSSNLMELLQQYMDAKRSQFNQFDSELLLVNMKGRKLYPKYVYNVVKKYLSGVTTIDKRSPHVLRHSFATHLMNGGAELNAVKELLGHSSLASTQVYTHNSIRKLQEIYKKAHPKA